MDYYKIIISPETIKGDLSTIDYDGQKVGIYSAMTQVLSGGTNGNSTLTGLTIPILIRQNVNDVGYFSPFDGALVQQNVVTNFIFSANTTEPYKFYVYNTSDEFQKFLELSSYSVDWGDGSQKQTITTYAPNNLYHIYPTANKEYTITLEQKNPWGINLVKKTIKTPYTSVINNNPNGIAYFVPQGGSWANTPISYNYIFSGDSNNEINPQTSNNYISVPFTVSGTTYSRINDLLPYGNLTPDQRVGLPIIKDGEIYGGISAISPTYTAYTIQSVYYYDYSDGTTIYFVPSSGITFDDIVAEPIVKEEVLLGVVDQPQIQSNIFIERGKNSAYEKIQRLGEVDNLGDLINYGYGFFKVEKKL